MKPPQPETCPRHCETLPCLLCQIETRYQITLTLGKDIMKKRSADNA